MAITIDGLQLYGADESTSVNEGGVDITSPPGIPSNLALAVSLTNLNDRPLSGVVTGTRLTSKAGYSSDPVTAVAEWIQQFETLCAAEQGTGWTVVDDERNETVTAVVTDVDWTVSAGSPAAVRWSLEAVQGEGVLDSSTRSPTSQSPNSSETLGGTDLGSVNEKRTELSISVETQPISFGDVTETIIAPDSGVTRRITIDGRKAGSTAQLRTFHNTLSGYVGSNQQLTYQTGIPGTSHNTVVAAYDDTWNAGVTGNIDYALTLFEGVII